MIRNRLPPDPDMRINAKSVYMLYCMMKAHMNGRYDCVKYNWRMRLSDAAFNKRRDKYYFAKLADKYNLRELYFLFLSNLVANTDAWVGEITDVDAYGFYMEYIGKITDAATRFDDDIKSLVYFSEKRGVTLKEIITYNPATETSGIFKLLQNRIISFESFMLLDSFLNIIDEHDKVAKDLIWQTYSVKMKAYKKLLVIDAAKARALFVKVVKECKEISQLKAETNS